MPLLKLFEENLSTFFQLVSLSLAMLEFLPPIFSLFARCLMLNLLIFFSFCFFSRVFLTEWKKAKSSLFASSLLWLTTTMKSNVHDEFLKNVCVVGTFAEASVVSIHS